MNKQLVDELIKFGLITNIDIDADKYEDVDDLIAQGVITIPGVKDKITCFFAFVKNIAVIFCTQLCSVRIAFHFCAK